MPHHRSLAAMAELVKQRQISPVELVDAHLHQIETVNPKINAFVEVFAEEARREARRLENQEIVGPLHGVPVTIKDSFDIAGHPTLCGSRFRLGHVADRDATAVRRLRGAGAIVLGKTSTPEFLNNYETDNHLIGRCNNPWDLSLTPGGSSGGESAAIASFCSPGGIGSDGGGSIRIPAHFTGIAGLKPTPGRVSAAGHYPQIAHPGGLLGVGGPMARTAEDVALLFHVLSGHDIEDPFSAPVPLRTPNLEQLRVGVWREMFDVPFAPGMLEAVDHAASVCQAVGFHPEIFQPAHLDSAPGLWWFFFERLFAPLTRQMIAGREDQAHWTGTELMYRALAMPPLSVDDVIGAMAARDRMRTHLFQLMEHYPVLLTPVCSTAAFPHRERPFDLLRMMTPVSIFNLFGMPAMVIPFGFSPTGLPVGVQLVARAWEEELLLEVAVRLENARGPFPLKTY